MTGDPRRRPPPAEPVADRAAEAFRDYRSGQRERMGDLVDLLTPLLWHTARAQGLDAGRAEDAVQNCWLRLIDRTDQIQDPQSVLGWLMTTVRREAWRQHRTDSRTPVAEVVDVRDQAPTPEALSVLRDDQRRLWAHISELNERCQKLLRVIAFAARPDYARLAEALGMPVGSIGPTRGRCLDKLRRTLLADGDWTQGRWTTP